MTADELTTILEWNIDFIKTCENKVSIILSIFGVILTLIFTSDNVKHIYGEVKDSVCLIIFAVLIMAYLAYGLGTLVRVLFAKSKRPEGLPESRIFFNDIANDKYDNFSETIKNYSDDDLQDDLIAQIYANSKICQKKFKNYNYGLVHSLSAFILFILFSVYVTIF